MSLSSWPCGSHSTWARAPVACTDFAQALLNGEFQPRKPLTMVGRLPSARLNPAICALIAAGSSTYRPRYLDWLAEGGTAVLGESEGACPVPVEVPEPGCSGSALPPELHPAAMISTNAA